MSAREHKGGGLPRPYTQGTFHKKLQEFEDLIRELTLQDVEATPEERRQMITENLRYDQFCDSIRVLFGADVHNQDLKAVYRKISTNPDAKVDWSELFGYFQSENEDKETVVGEEVSVFTVSARRRVGDAAGDRKRRDIIVSIRYIEGMDCYLTASQKGAVSVWSSKLRLQACSDMNEAAWVTGCDYLRSIRRVATCTERSICIWDNRAKGKNQLTGHPDQKPVRQVFSIKPIEDSPQCICWVPHSTAPHEDTVLFGDDQGYVNVLTVAAKDLTVKSAKQNAAQTFTQTHALEPSKLTYPIHRRRLHDDWVVKIKYFPELRCFASCSPSSRKSFVLEEVDRLLDDGEIRGVGITKGVNAFDYCARANILATGGVDKVIRVWHPHIFSRPTGKLIGHLFTIVDIACNEKDQHIISLSTARVFRIWDIHTLTSLQVFTDNEDRPGEKRIYSILFDNKHDRLLSGSSVFDCWPLTRAVQDTMQVPHSHDRPISQICYNKELNQVVTLCSETVIRVWEAESGKQVYQIHEAHGPNIEVTALTLDKSGYRMATGAYDGSLKVWDFGSGQEIKHKEGRGPDEEFAIHGLEYCTIDDQRCLVVAGWHNTLRIVADFNDSNDLHFLREFSDTHYVSRVAMDHTEMTSRASAESPFSKHAVLPSITPRGSDASITSVFRKENLLSSHELSCLGALLPDTMATGSSNGDVIMWDLANSGVQKLLILPEDDIDTSRTEEADIDPDDLTDSNSSAVQATVLALKFLEHKKRRLHPRYLRRKRPRSPSEGEEGDGKKSEASHTKLTQATSNMDVDEPNPAQKTERSDTVAESQAMETEKVKERDDTQIDEARRDLTEPLEEKKKQPTEDDNPENNFVVETFPPVLVTCHQDSFIRFWNMEGTLLRDISAMTRRQGSPVTALCHDPDCNILVTGDQKGYLTMWEIGEFLENPMSEATDAVKQVLCWRAHLAKVVQLEHVDTTNAWISGSVDGSVRVWWGQKGHFVGFFGQHRGFSFPSSIATAGPAMLPYDITEPPLVPVKAVSARQKIRAQQKFEYPLVFDNMRWKPFRRSAYIEEKEQKPVKPQEPTDKKFFKALIKPRLDNSHLESYARADWKTGAVFRALPVYRVRTPSKPKTPQFSFPTNDEDGVNPMLFGMTGAAKKNKKSIAGRHGPLPNLVVPQGSPSRTNAMMVPSPRKR